MEKYKLIRNLISIVLILAIAIPYNTVYALSEILDESQGTFIKEGDRYITYVSDRNPNGNKVGYDKISYNIADASLLVDNQEKVFEKNIFTHATSYVYYTDIQDYGYEKFESWVGLKNTSRGKGASVIFRVYLDDKLAWESGEIKSDDNAKFVSVDISDAKILKLEVDSNGVNAFDHALWGDAKFIKSEPTPYLVVSDKEFAYPGQVTPENILEGVFARTLSGEIGKTDDPIPGRSKGTLKNGKEGNDLTDYVTYTTDYVKGSTGKFKITYHVTDKQGFTRSRTVNASVRSNQRVVLNADMEYLKTPFASFEYMCRDYLSEQGKAAFDYSLDKLLHFTDDAADYPIVNVWGESLAEVTLNLQEQGIYMSPDEAAYLNSMLMDNEPRIYHIKDWGSKYTTSEGMVETVTFYVPEKYAVDGYYEKRLRDVEVNASRFLSNYEEGMTDAQALKAVLYPYADWIKYRGGGQLMDEALANGQGVCGGNSRGGIYLSKRIGIKSYWVRTGPHAWFNVKLNDADIYKTREGDTGKSENISGYYRIDLLARPGCFISVDTNNYNWHGHHGEIWFSRSPGYPDMTRESLPLEYTAWPNSTININQKEVIIGSDEVESFNPRSLIESASNVYMGDIKNSINIDDGGLNDSIKDGSFAPGEYTITYSHIDNRGNKISKTKKIKVLGNATDLKDLEKTSSNAGQKDKISLWDGSKEVTHSEDNEFYINDGGSITANVSGKDFNYMTFWTSANVTTRENQAYGSNCKFRPVITAIYEDGHEEEIYRHDERVGWYTSEKYVVVKIPENVSHIKISLTDLGSGNGHAAFGNPRFYKETPIMSIIGVENEGYYEKEAIPEIKNYKTYEMYYRGFEPNETRISNSEKIEWNNGDKLEKAGIYTLKVTDYYDNISTVIFYIGKAPVLPKVTGINEGVNSPGITPVVENASRYELYKDGTLANWNSGDEINDEGSYKIIVYYDDNGLEKFKIYEFEVKKEDAIEPPDTGEIPDGPTEPDIELPSTPDIDIPENGGGNIENPGTENPETEIPDGEDSEKPSKPDSGNTVDKPSNPEIDNGNNSTENKPVIPDNGNNIENSYDIEKIIGKNRYETAALIADGIGNYDTAILINAENTMSDGLSASALSGKENAPILLTKQNSIPQVTLDRLKKASTVYIIGGEKAISKNVENLLADKKIIRIGGSSRYETSEMIAKHIGEYNKAFIVNGLTGDADAISASAIAAKYKAPIILTNGKDSNFDKKDNTEYYIIGGEKAMSDKLVSKYSAERIAGKDRYDTNRSVVDKFYKNTSKYYYANGTTLVDALTVSILAKDYGVVLVSDKSDNSILENKDLVQIGGIGFDVLKK